MRLITIAGVQVYWDGKCLEYTAGLAVDADGSPRCYHPISARGLDHLANSGYPKHKWYRHVLYCVHGRPVVQDGRSPAQPCEGYFISMTSYVRAQYDEDDVRRYVDAEAVPYVVVPKQVPGMIRPRVLGCRAVVEREGMDPVECAVIDLGPRIKIGEGSVKLAKELSINPSPRNGGTEQRIVRYRLYPGVPAEVNGEVFKLRSAV